MLRVYSLHKYLNVSISIFSCLVFQYVSTFRYNSFLLEQRRKTLKEKLARKERKKEKKRRKILEEGGVLPKELKEVLFLQFLQILSVKYF